MIVSGEFRCPSGRLQGELRILCPIHDCAAQPGTASNPCTQVITRARENRKYDHMIACVSLPMQSACEPAEEERGRTACKDCTPCRRHVRPGHRYSDTRRESSIGRVFIAAQCDASATFTRCVRARSTWNPPPCQSFARPQRSVPLHGCQGRTHEQLTRGNLHGVLQLVAGALPFRSSRV
jgi:hypothetical protein